MAESGAFILPSRFEPWGVVVQEATAAGLPLICSNKVGASVHLLQDYFNGFSFMSGNSNQLMERMTAVSCMEREEIRRMRLNSSELSKQFSPARWAKTLVTEIAKFEPCRSSHPSNNRKLVSQSV